MRPTGTSASVALPSSLPRIHPDYSDLAPIVDSILSTTQGMAGLQTTVGDLLRDCFDSVIKTARTGRRFLHEIEKTEKTHIGTCVEIEFRNALDLARGQRLDLQIAGSEVDVKFTIGKSWMVPREALNQACILISANESKSLFSFGVVIARPSYLTKPNQDKKGSIGKLARTHVWWLIRDASYPVNFWLTVPSDRINHIVGGRTGNDRMVRLFTEVQDRSIPRKVIEDVAGRHKDALRRVRKDTERGAPSILAKQKVVVLSGHRLDQREFAVRVGLKPIGPGEFMAHRLRRNEIRHARSIGLIV